LVNVYDEGNDNIAIGVESLQNAVDAHSNQGIGTWALQNKTEGNNNIAIGDEVRNKKCHW